jgi:uncharacterized Fe-S cluster-containing radical SAM superfamily enzyme
MKRFYFEPTSYCQLECSLCPSTDFDSDRQGFMDLELFKLLIAQASSQGIISEGDEAHLYGFGEPLIHKKLGDMIRVLSDIGVVTKINTNGLLLSSNRWDEISSVGLSKCLISIDGISQEVYQQYRVGGDVETLKTNIQYVCSNARDSIVELQFIAFSHNVHEIDQFLEFAYQINPHIATIKKPRSWDGSDKNYVGLSGLKPEHTRTYETNSCKFFQDYGMVLQNGDLTICSADPFGKYVVGNLFEQGSGLWLSKEFQDLKLTALNEGIPLCQNCGYENSYVEKIRIRE